MATAQEVIARAGKDLGKNGNDINKWMGLSNGTAWCASAQSFWAYECGKTGFTKSAAVSGIYPQLPPVAKMSLSEVQVGDLACFNWDGRTDTGWMDHIGIVTWIDGATGQFGTREGNTSNIVADRTRTIRGGYFVVFCRPTYSGASSGDTKPSQTKSNAAVAKEVYAGKYGNDPDRSRKLKAEGYDPSAIQKLVNELAKGNKIDNTTSGGSVSQSKPSYSVNKNYVTKVSNLNVRTGPGTGYAKKNKSQLTSGGKKQSNSAGQLNSGVTVTCMEVRNAGSDIWIRIPSGWVAAYYGGRKYVG